jgi:membrane protease subunit HflK
MFRQEEPEVNLDQVAERIRAFLGRFRLGGGGGAFGVIILGGFVVMLLIWMGTGFYTVQPGEQAALRRFGMFDSIQGPGLNWFWPSPIGTRAIVPVAEVRRLELGVRGDQPIPLESLMITGDADENGNPGEAPNIADVQLLVQYDIKNIEQFLFRVVDPAGITIKHVAETSLRQVIGSRPIDDVLTDKKEDIQAETKLLLQKLLDDYETGINVREVKLLAVFAPEQVRDAFDDVVRAQEDKARIINLADAYKEDILPRARGDAARVLQGAEGFKQEQIAKATGEASRFLAVLEEYEKAKDVTRQRLYLEAMEEILPGITKFIVAAESGGNLLQFLPLNGAAPPVPAPTPQPAGSP